MKHGKYETRRRSPRVFTALIALVLTLCCAAGGTIAWLTYTPDPVTGTFVVGNIGITLSDTKNVLKTETANTSAATNTVTYVPGETIDVEPIVSVNAGSEACFLFIHIKEENNTFGTANQKVIPWELWTPDEDKGGAWNEVTGHTGYYYREVAKRGENAATYRIFKTSKLTVNCNLAASDIATINSGTYPTITITAAAVQKENIPDSNENGAIDWPDAWALLPTSFTGETSSGNYPQC